MINTVLNCTFKVTARVAYNKDPTVNFKYDKKFLVLEDAVLENNEIYWEFRTIWAGTTQVMVVYDYGEPLFGNERIFDVDIYWPMTNPAHLASSGPGLSDEKIDIHFGLIEPFFGRINVAVDKVYKAFPGAGLYSVNCMRPFYSIGPAYAWIEIPRLVAIFVVGEDKVIITSDEWGCWGEPKKDGGPDIGNKKISWPPKSWDLNLEGAVEILNKASFTSSFFGCLLAQNNNPRNTADIQVPYN